MRIYAPAGTVETLDRLLAEPRIQDALVEHRVLPAREAQVAPFPEWLDKRLVRGLHAQGIEMLYTHQRDALDALRDGKDIVVVTPTASGKTLCYGLPVLQAVADDPAARALFLFPTKALSQDQLAAFRELSAQSDMNVQAGVYDGDTPGPIRTNIRTSGQVVVTNPDSQAAILPDGFTIRGDPVNGTPPDDGCGCRQAGRGGNGGLWLFALLLLLIRWRAKPAE